jgi:hypothetical protein
MPKRTNTYAIACIQSRMQYHLSVKCKNLGQDAPVDAPKALFKTREILPFFPCIRKSERHPTCYSQPSVRLREAPGEQSTQVQESGLDMRIVIVSPQWTEDPLFDLGFHEVFHEGLGQDVYAHVTALGSLFQPLISMRKCLPRLPQTAAELRQALHNATLSAHALLASALTPGGRPLAPAGRAFAPAGRPEIQWVQKPGLTFRSVNDKYFASWARDASIDLVVLVGISENTKVNLLTSAKNIVEIKIDRSRPRPRNGARTAPTAPIEQQGDNGSLVIRTLVESRAASHDVVYMELGDLSQLDSQMIGEFAVSYFSGYMARIRQQDLETKPKGSATDPASTEINNIELVTRHNG